MLERLSEKWSMVLKFIGYEKPLDEVLRSKDMDVRYKSFVIERKISTIDPRTNVSLLQKISIDDTLPIDLRNSAGNLAVSGIIASSRSPNSTLGDIVKNYSYPEETNIRAGMGLAEYYVAECRSQDNPDYSSALKNINTLVSDKSVSKDVKRHARKLANKLFKDAINYYSADPYSNKIFTLIEQNKFVHHRTRNWAMNKFYKDTNDMILDCSIADTTESYGKLLRLSKSDIPYNLRCKAGIAAVEGYAKHGRHYDISKVHSDKFHPKEVISEAFKWFTSVVTIDDFAFEHFYNQNPVVSSRKLALVR